MYNNEKSFLVIPPNCMHSINVNVNRRKQNAKPFLRNVQSKRIDLPVYGDVRAESDCVVSADNCFIFYFFHSFFRGFTREWNFREGKMNTKPKHL